VPSTTFHFPVETLRQIDAAAARHGVSRNRFVMLACERALSADDGAWPDGFFDPGFGSEERALLDEGTRELEQVVTSNRHNRGAPFL